jgi:hypothetical protein
LRDKEKWTMHAHYKERMSAFRSIVKPASATLATSEHRDIVILRIKETALQYRDRLFLE